MAPAPGESALAPLLAPALSAAHHPPGRRAAGSGAGCLAPGQPHAPGLRTSSGSGSSPATCVPVLQGRSGPQSPRPLRPSVGDHSLPFSTLTCSHCQPAPPNSLVPRSFAFISVKTDFAEKKKTSHSSFLERSWDVDDQVSSPWVCLESRGTGPQGRPLHPQPRPTAHLPFPRTPPGRCPGRCGPGVGRCTPHHLTVYGSGSRCSASCVGVAGCRARTPARAAGTAGRGARPWLSASGWHRGSGRCWARTGAGVDPALSPWAAKFQFRFPQEPSLFPAEPFPVLSWPPFLLLSVRSGTPYLGTTVYAQKHKTKYKHLKIPRPWRMDFPKGAGIAAYNEKSETDIYGESCSRQIPINHDDLKILKKNESQLCEVLQDKFGCISILVSPAQERNSESLQVFRKMLTPGLALSVWKDNLTRHAVDAVVNAANEDLKHGGGLALALVKAGGQEIQEASTRFVSTSGKVPTGEIVITGAGKLPCKLIIHAVGPRWVEVDREQCIHKLQTAIKNILDYAMFHNRCLETVAIPALSSGIFNFPLTLCTQIIVETIRLYFQGVKLMGNLKEIHLVSNEDPTVAAFKAASETILGMNELRSWGNQEATPPFNTTVMSNLTVHIVQGLIELQETDVIVNSVTPSHYFGAGPVSRSILQQAGDEIEQEFKKNMLQTSQDSQLVLVTKGFKLSCQYVFHVLWPSEYSRTDMRLKNAVRKCLEKCLELNLTSIAFPALGTGNIGVCKDQAAKIMLGEVLMFACTHLRKQLTVKFVIFPLEMEIYKAFTTEMERQKSQLRILSNNRAPWKTREEKRENELKAKSPAINLMGSDWDKMNEAEEWIKRLLTCQDKHVIENNHILYLEKKEHDILSQLQNTSRVSIKEIIYQEKTILEIKGAQADIVEVVINIEHMLCEVQEKMAKEKEQALWNLLGQWTGQQPKKQDEMKTNKFLKHLAPLTQEIQDRMKQFEHCGLRVIKVEKIDNEVLMAAFQKKKKMMEGRTQRAPMSRRLFQQVPPQLCDVVCRVGFQRMYSAPCDPKYGAGIYFTTNLKNIAYRIKKTSATNNLICVFEAEVLTGSFCQGHELNIVPPPLSPGDINSHDSVVDNVSSPETFVIFSGVQAMPQYLWTCMHVWPQDCSSKPQPLGVEFSSGSSVD